MRAAIQHPFFNYFTDEAKEKIITEKPPFELGPNSVIFDEGDEFDGMYLVIDEKVNFHKSLPNGKLQFVSYSGPGSHFGELGIFTDKPRSLRAVTVSVTHLIHIEEATVIELIEKNQFPLVNCIQGLVHHLNETTEQYVESVVQQQQLAVVGQMVSSLIHDFRSPLGTISLGAQFLQSRFKEDEKAVKTCTTIESQVNRINRMTVDILDYVRGEHHLEIRPIHFPKFFDEFRELFPSFFESLETEICFKRDQPFVLAGDFDRIIRIFQNLISNALDALANQPESFVKISARNEEDQVVITVTDNGPGIPMQIKDTLFEPFVTHGKSYGTGLGMAIVKRCVEAHKGTIAFESDTSGTSFELTLPIKQ
ncbi:MAG: cyclic nucleotide-binding domain-containing protein [Opitutales bacterium]|nr:cyclic nucleotide-binding domain-containing protein [Opitutales bacterium]